MHATLCRSCFELRISDFEFSLRSGCHARALACHPEDFENAGRDFWCGDDAKPRRGGLKPPSLEQTAIENRRSLSSNARMLIFNELQKHVIGSVFTLGKMPPRGPRPMPLLPALQFSKSEYRNPKQIPIEEREK